MICKNSTIARWGFSSLNNRSDRLDERVARDSSAGAPLAHGACPAPAGLPVNVTMFFTGAAKLTFQVLVVVGAGTMVQVIGTPIALSAGIMP